MQERMISHLTDHELTTEVGRLARNERDATVALVAHLAEFGARRLYLPAGFSSLFTYCREVLELSEGEAYNRVVAARAVRRFPAILGRLADGSVNLTTLRLLYKHLTLENQGELLDASTRKSKRDVERLIAVRFPQAVAPPSVRKMPSMRDRSVRHHSSALEPSPVAPSGVGATPDLAPVPETVPPWQESTPGSGTTLVVAQTPVRANRPATVQPVAENQYSVRFTASTSTWEKLQVARDLLSHAVPDGDLAQVFDRALDALLENLSKARFAATARPRESGGAQPGSRTVPATVKRAVWARDGGRCAFASASGRRCSERGRLEFHHVSPFAAGGKATVQNIQLRCRGHNAHEAGQFYGPMREWVDTVGEAIPGWDVSPTSSRSEVSRQQPRRAPDDHSCTYTHAPARSGPPPNMKAG